MTQKKTLTLKKKRTTSTATGAGASISPMRKLRGKKRIIINTGAGITPQNKKKPVKRTKKPTQPQIKKTPPSEIKARELDQLLGERFTAWRDNEPLRIGIEKEIFQLISAEHLPYSKRVVKKVLKRHCTSTAYLNSVLHGNSRVSLDNAINGDISSAEKSYARSKLDNMD